MKTSLICAQSFGSLLALSLLAAAAPVKAEQIYWTDWISQGQEPGFTGFGSITTPTSTVDVTYSNPMGISFYYTGARNEADFWVQVNGHGYVREPATSPYTSSAVDNIPTGTDLIALMYAGVQTLTFSKPIANPVFSFLSLNGNGYAFDQDFEILSFAGTGGGRDNGYFGAGDVHKEIVPVGDTVEYQLDSFGGEPQGTIRFLGTFSSVSWRSLSDENWNGFTVGVEGTEEEVYGSTVPEASTFLPAGLAVAAVFARRMRRK